ncbi:hypothetical protein TRVL_09363 [Trypanosoma vivax]|nr:hypothetical protein TRVL_09363 [Trypanosoma vivax]
MMRSVLHHTWTIPLGALCRVVDSSKRMLLPTGELFRMRVEDSEEPKTTLGAGKDFELECRTRVKLTARRMWKMCVSQATGTGILPANSTAFTLFLCCLFQIVATSVCEFTLSQICQLVLQAKWCEHQ